MSARYTLDCPGLRLKNYANERMHYMAEHRDKKHVWTIVRTYGMRLGNTVPLDKAHVRVEVTKPGKLFDADGLECALKPVYDALKHWLIVDDSPKHITRENAQQHGAGWNVRVEVYEATDERREGGV